MINKMCETCGIKRARIRFCSNKCKDRFHNVTNPRGHFKHLKADYYAHEVGMDSREDGCDGHKDTF